MGTFLAAFPLVLLLVAGVIFHGRDVKRREPGALRAGLLGTFVLGSYLYFLCA